MRAIVAALLELQPVELELLNPRSSVSWEDRKTRALTWVQTADSVACLLAL